MQLVLEDRVRETLKRGGGLERRPDKETAGPTGLGYGFRGKVRHLKTCLENVIQQLQVRQPEKEAAATRPISKS